MVMRRGGLDRDEGGRGHDEAGLRAKLRQSPNAANDATGRDAFLCKAG
ncbi:hypothetical protein [Qipengyuania atrilutea]|uniref:Uncharacterized protein n=1 Tax=Qipengyuania atrilutea TaxID=2744473 RepID=A0A850H1Q7_9SPHN|nr:hypothetical protein [Actirhodobacter atriluteus]NVD45924.1 hypothetical protein [Actirhodobacter atriluteus]